MKRLLSKIPYNHRVAIVIMLFTLLPCIILGSIYLRTERNQEKQSLLSNYYSYVDTTATLASKTISSMEAKMDYLIYDFKIQPYLANINELTLSETLALIDEIREAVSIISLENSNVTARWYPEASTTTCGDYCQTLDMLISEFPNGSDDPDYQSIFTLKDYHLLWKVRNIIRQPGDLGVSNERLCLYSRFSAFNRSGCILEISLPVADLMTPTESDLPKGSLFAICLNQGDNFEYISLSSPFDSAKTTSLLSSYMQGGSLAEYEVIQSPIANAEHSQVLLLLPKTYVDNLLRPIVVQILLVYLLIAVIILCTCYLTSYLLTRKILSAIKEMRQDIATVIVPPVDEDGIPTDIQKICTQVKKLVKNAQDYSRKIDYYEKESIRSELELLQMRFNPHLLYNTLAALNHQARDPRAREAIVSLCNYYRIILHNGHLIIRMQDELAMVKEYLDVMKYTYCLDHIDYQFEVDEDVLQCTVIKHVLQPIVENAIHHGLRPLPQGGLLRICGHIDADCLCIQVIDNGKGMTAEETQKLLSKPSNSTYGGYGIFNVQSRLQLQYGKEYGLTIETNEGKGTCVTMRIPKIPDTESLSVPYESETTTS